MEINKLENYFNFFKGKGISKNDVCKNGEYKCIRYGELYTKYGENIDHIYSKTNISDNIFLSKRGDILIPSSGETSIDLATASRINEDGVLIGGDINILRPKNSLVNSLYITYLLNSSKKHEISKLAQGSSIIHLYNDALKTLCVGIHPIETQNKISFLLSSIDQLINIFINYIFNANNERIYL